MLFLIAAPDTTPPVVTGCPQDITRQLSTGQTSIAVSWTVPTATDDRTPTYQITVTASHQPNQLFSVGTSTVNYIFTDQSGNFARCTFNINIQGRYLFMQFIYSITALENTILFYVSFFFLILIVNNYSHTSHNFVVENQMIRFHHALK